MDVNFIDSEISVKMKEVFKSILKRYDVKIVFETPNGEEDIIESTSVKHDIHNFVMQKNLCLK